MGKETEGFVAHKTVDGNLFDSKNDRTIGQVLLDDGPGAGVGLHRVGPSVGGLDDNFDAFPDQLPDVGRGKWSSAFPDRLVLSKKIKM